MSVGSVSPLILLSTVREEKERRICEESLVEFTKRAFHIIEPGVKFVDNWHVHAIAEHLEAITYGKIDNLLVNIPPGTMKSILISVTWPAWEWTMFPNLRYLGASYGSDLAIRDASKCRDIITSEWYQRKWPHVQMKAGEDQKLKYALTQGGWRMATSVGGRATGEHPDRKIVDDPHNAKQAESQAERTAAITWFDRTLSTRGQSRNAKTVVVMQRLHEQDMSGHILNDIGGYEHLCIPMEYVPTKRATSLGWKDPRKKKGELLWPELFPDSTVLRIKKLLGSYGTSGQMQQNPVPEGGGMIKTKKFRLWPAAKALPQFEFIVQSYDCAFTENTLNDPTALSVWGVFTYEGIRQGMVLDAWDEYLEYPELRKRVIANWKTEYGYIQKGGPLTKPRKPDIVLVENKASGQSLIQELRRSNVPAYAFNPGTADKIARAHQAAPVLELDILWIPESAKLPGQFATWAEPFVTQLSKFPVAEHDDYVDTYSQVVIYLRNAGWFELPIAEDRESDKIAREPKINPYAA